MLKASLGWRIYIRSEEEVLGMKKPCCALLLWPAVFNQCFNSNMCQHVFLQYVLYILCTYYLPRIVMKVNRLLYVRRDKTD